MIKVQANINEMFYSIQGEGILTGSPTFFVRFQGCNVGCVWCDSKPTWASNKQNEIKVLDCLKEIRSQINKNIWLCFTGGEPLEQSEALMFLISKLKNSGFDKISLETSGCMRLGKKYSLPDQKFIANLSLLDVFCSISPKLQSALLSRFDFDLLVSTINLWQKNYDTSKMQLKFVIGEKADLGALYRLCSDSSVFTHDNFWYLQLEAGNTENDDLLLSCMEFQKKHPQFRITIQQHKVLHLR